MVTKIEKVEDVKPVEIEDILINTGKSKPGKNAKKFEKEIADSQRDMLVHQHVLTTDLAFGDMQKSQKKLFDVVKDAYLDLKDDDKALGKYKTNVKCDRSSINKIITIVKNDTLVRFSEKLPVSWATLYAVSKFEKDDLVDAIEQKKIDCESTLAEVNKVRSEYPSSGKESSANADPKAKRSTNEIEVNTCWVDLDALPNLSKKDRQQVVDLLAQIHSYGIQVTGVDLFTARKAA